MQCQKIAVVSDGSRHLCQSHFNRWEEKKATKARTKQRMLDIQLARREGDYRKVAFLCQGGTVVWVV